MGRYLILVLLVSFTFQALTAAPKPEQHLELELTSSDYQNLLKDFYRKNPQQKHALDPVMAMGKKSLEWLEFINAHREPENQISFSSPSTQPAYPIEAPRISNPTLILKEFEGLKQTLPGWYQAVLFDGAEFAENPPVPDEEFIQLGMRVEFNYTRASRWLLQEPELEQYAARRRDDIRGYYFAAKDSQFESKLALWSTLGASEKETFSSWLIGMCRNANVGEPTCKKELEKTISEHSNPVAFNAKYFSYGKRRYNSFFDLAVKRGDVEWSPGKPNLMILPFQEPVGTEGAKDFLISNIEEEWQWLPWQLKLFFTKSKNHPKVEFVAGATPHVNGLGGSIITMDANKPLTEYDVRWTIRHEFGHVMGFPDCYVEFYDSTENLMVSYQLDITNLMCSRRGKLQKIHVDQLKKMYMGKQQGQGPIAKTSP